MIKLSGCEFQIFWGIHQRHNKTRDEKKERHPETTVFDSGFYNRQIKGVELQSVVKQHHPNGQQKTYDIKRIKIHGKSEFPKLRFFYEGLMARNKLHLKNTLSLVYVFTSIIRFIVLGPIAGD